MLSKKIEEEEEEEEESEKVSVLFYFFKIRNGVISWVGGMGDVKKVGKIEIEDNGEKKQINNDRTPRGTKGRPQASRIDISSLTSRIDIATRSQQINIAIPSDFKIQTVGMKCF